MEKAESGYVGVNIGKDLRYIEYGLAEVEYDSAEVG
jgi:hypothetical protein